MDGLRDEKPEPRRSGGRRSEPLRDGGCLAEVISRVEESLRDMVVVGGREGGGREKGIYQINKVYLWVGLRAAGTRSTWDHGHLHQTYDRYVWVA